MSQEVGLLEGLLEKIDARRRPAPEPMEAMLARVGGAAATLKSTPTVDPGWAERTEKAVAEKAAAERDAADKAAADKAAADKAAAERAAADKAAAERAAAERAAADKAAADKAAADKAAERAAADKAAADKAAADKAAAERAAARESIDIPLDIEEAIPLVSPRSNSSRSTPSFAAIASVPPVAMQHAVEPAREAAASGPVARIVGSVTVVSPKFGSLIDRTLALRPRD